MSNEVQTKDETAEAPVGLGEVQRVLSTVGCNKTSSGLARALPGFIQASHRTAWEEAIKAGNGCGFSKNATKDVLEKATV